MIKLGHSFLALTTIRVLYTPAPIPTSAQPKMGTGLLPTPLSGVATLQPQCVHPLYLLVKQAPIIVTDSPVFIRATALMPLMEVGIS